MKNIVTIISNIILYNIDTIRNDKYPNGKIFSPKLDVYIHVLEEQNCSSVLHPIHTSYRFLITRRRAPNQQKRKRGEKARIVRRRLVGVVTRTFRPLANLRPRRCFPVSASPPDRPSSLFLTRKSARNDDGRPIPRLVRHIGFPSAVVLSLSLFFFLLMKSSIFFTRKIVEYT